jgi:carboxylesterase
MEDAEREPGGNLLRGASPVTIEKGRSRCCLLVHGFMSCPADFGPLPEALDKAGWDVRAPLLPGHGTDPRDLQGVSADDLYRAVETEYLELRDRYRQVGVVGFSLGGSLCSLLTGLYNPAAVILVNPFFASTARVSYVLPPRWWLELLSPLLDYVVQPSWVKRVRRPEGAEEAVAYRIAPVVAFQEVFDVADAAVARQLENTSLLVLYSREDGTASPVATRSFFENAKAGPKKLRAFDNSDHLLFLDYDAQEAVNATMSFLESLEEPVTEQGEQPE